MSSIGYRIFGQVINSVGKILDFGLEWGKGCLKRAAWPYTFASNHSGSKPTRDSLDILLFLFYWDYLFLIPLLSLASIISSLQRSVETDR